MHKRDVIRLIEDWLVEREAYQNTPVHPLVSVQEGHLSEGGQLGGMKQTRASGRSKPPIRDMRGVNPRGDRVMSAVREVDKTWYDALIYYTVLGSLGKVAEEQKCSKSEIRVRFDSGVACFKGAWVA